MKKQIIILLSILIILNIGLMSTIMAYNYINTPHYGDTEYNGVPIRYIPMNTTDGSIFGYWDEYGVTIYTTGNQTEDEATFYHELYHVMNIDNKDDDVGAENYAAKMVKGYIPKNNT